MSAIPKGLRRAGAVLCLAAACSGGPVDPSVTPLQALTTTHFVFHYPAADAASIQQTAARLEGEYDRIVADLGASAMPVVQVTFYTTHAALVAGAGPNAGVIPTWATGLVTAVDQVHMMSPSVAGPYDRAVSNLVHEFAHCVSMRVKPNIPNNPRWLWEAVAVYEARQFVDPRSLGYLTAGQPPPFSRLDSFDNSFAYDLGFLIAEFVVDRWGRDRLVALVQANGDTQAAVGMPLSEFETQWFAAVRSKYGF